MKKLLSMALIAMLLLCGVPAMCEAEISADDAVNAAFDTVREQLSDMAPFSYETEYIVVLHITDESDERLIQAYRNDVNSFAYVVSFAFETRVEGSPYPNLEWRHFGVDNAGVVSNISGSDTPINIWGTSGGYETDMFSSPLVQYDIEDLPEWNAE